MNEIKVEVRDGYIIDMSEPPKCEFCGKPVGSMSEKECDFHLGYLRGYEAHRVYIGSVIKDLMK